PQYRKEKVTEEGPDHGWTSERMRKAMQTASMRWIGVKINISAWRNIAIAISRRFCREAPFEKDEIKPEDVGENGPDINEDNPYDLQSGHTTHIASMIYAQELVENRDVVVSRRQKFREESSSPELERKRKRPKDDMQDAQIARWKQLRTVDIESEMRSIVGKEAEFRGKQKEALTAIISNSSPILVIMGTGAGKSLLFQLLARSQKSRTTVVVVPLKTLERSAVLKERGKQMIFLTATLAPAREAEFFEIMRMERVPPIRGVTTRPGIRYSVFEYEAEMEQSNAVGRLIR
ncbi:hypothetical protein V501_01877, partial [Pseudogymnoascus sp. VKM F-4519 (FW-2642)]